VIVRPKKTSPYSMQPFSPGPYRVHVVDTKVLPINAPKPTMIDAIGPQSFRSSTNWARLRARLNDRSGTLGAVVKILEAKEGIEPLRSALSLHENAIREHGGFLREGGNV
jgi:hypothetical protein